MGNQSNQFVNYLCGVEEIEKERNIVLERNEFEVIH
jgi:hypothetical protein